MALNWKWDEKIGEAVIQQTFDNETKEYTKSLYEGNAFLIFLSEWKEKNVDTYSLYTFFADERHAKICLGLAADSTGSKRNIFTDGFDTLVKIRINKKKARNYKKIVTLFAQAFDTIDIEIYNEEKPNDNNIV